MKQVLVLIIALIFFIIGGCQGKPSSAKSQQTNENFVADLVRNDVLEMGGKSNAALTNAPLMESISNTMQPAADSENVKPVTNITTADSRVKPETPIRDNEMNRQMEKPSQEVIPASVPRKGSYIKAGTDDNGQAVSYKKPVKLTFAVFNAYKTGKTVDFRVYAVPKNAELNRNLYYLIGYGKNIDIINGQAQFTRYWGGYNTGGAYFPKGRYNIYLLYSIKDAKGKVVFSTGRYWGMSQNSYLRLY